MQGEPTTAVQPAPVNPAELGLRLIDFERQLSELAGQLASELAALSDLDAELADLGGVA